MAGMYLISSLSLLELSAFLVFVTGGLLYLFGTPKILRTLQTYISRRSHAFISSTLAKTYNESVSEKKREMFQMVTQHLNSNDNVRILEIGAGSGANLEFYPSDVSIQFVAVDPNKYMERYLRKNMESFKNIRLEKFSTDYAENMKDIPDNSIDCLVSTIVLCSVTEQKAVLAEVKRVLKPGCPFFFMEHVAAKPGSFLDKSQRTFSSLWSFCFDGCDVTRETITEIANAGFREVNHKTFDARLFYMFSLLRPHIYGYALK